MPWALPVPRRGEADRREAKSCPGAFTHRALLPSAAGAS